MSANDSSSARLTVRDLEIRLTSDDSEVVSDVSFSVHSGEVLGVVGESGSGKTTVALALLGYARRGLRISSGEILLDGSTCLRCVPECCGEFAERRCHMFLRIRLPHSTRPSRSARNSTRIDLSPRHGRGSRTTGSRSAEGGPHGSQP